MRTKKHKYTVNAEEIWNYTVTIEAKDEEEARDKFLVLISTNSIEPISNPESFEISTIEKS